jgi:transcription elongation factor GreA
VTTDTRAGAPDLLRELGLLVDGPARWGSPAPSRLPGVFMVELPGGAESAPVDIVAVRRWIERVPAMRLDGETPTPQTLARRLHDFWLADEPILYVGRSAKSISGRVAALYATALGDAKPHSGGHWLKTLSVLNDLRIWWSETDAHEEYEDALIELVAQRNASRTPFANLAAPDGSPRPTGLTNSLLAGSPNGTTPAKAAAKPVARKPAATTVRKARTPTLKDPIKPKADPTYLSREGMDKLTAELENLRTSVRPEVIARVKAARELGDLRENGDYEYARKEQSFVEGRIQALEALLRTGQVIDDLGAPAEGAALGSTVVVESEGERQEFMLVSSAEANAASGRISNVSPVGRALIGARAGDEVTVELPGGSVVYALIEVR